MARTARIVLPGVPMHVIQRGNNRQRCFRNDGDLRRLLRILKERVDNTACAVHAYVLMTNHMHLLVTPPDTLALAALMKSVLQEYTQYFNLKHRRTGGLWEGRFRSCLVQTEEYFLVCQRYIELNPVRAGMVSDPADYRWSSHRFNGRGIADPLVAPHATYLSLGPDEDARRSIYRGLFRTTMDDCVVEQIRHAVHCNGVLGSSAFTRQIEDQTGQKMRRNQVGRPRKNGA